MGQCIILLDLEKLYESLYDAMNQVQMLVGFIVLGGNCIELLVVMVALGRIHILLNEFLFKLNTPKI